MDNSQVTGWKLLLTTVFALEEYTATLHNLSCERERLELNATFAFGLCRLCSECHVHSRTCHSTEMRKLHCNQASRL
jgi:hypothetical protein